MRGSPDAMKNMTKHVKRCKRHVKRSLLEAFSRRRGSLEQLGLAGGRRPLVSPRSDQAWKSF